MHAPTKKKHVVENVDVATDAVLATQISNGEDLAPVVRLAFESGKPDTLVSQLKNIVRKKEIEIEELCKLHYEEFIIAVDELRGVLVDAEELKGMLSSENVRLQQAGTALLLKLEELVELYSIKKNVSDALQKLKFCVQVLNLCLMCNNQVSEGKFHPALKTLDSIEKEYLHNIAAKKLRRVIEKHIPAIKLYIEKKVCSEFNDWLVKVRSASRQIGHLAIGQATAARQKEEELRSRQRQADEQSSSGVVDHVYSLDVEHAEEDPILEFDLTPVYRAHHMHCCLGIEEKFCDYYYKNRLMQLNLDLQISTMQPFLESHQPFFAQITGYFIVEDRVFRTAGRLLSESQVESVWETAVSKMTSILEAQFSRMDTATHLLLIKDFVTLLGATLSQHGYQVAPLLDVLDKSRDKYHELLLNDCRKQISDFLSIDTFEPMVIRKESEYNMFIVSFNLHSSEAMPTFPYVAPFSSFVPDSCRIVKSFIEDSVSYLSYGGRMNFYEFVKKYLDKLLIEVLNVTLLNMIHNGTLGISQAMQVAANIAVFQGCCDLFLFQAAKLCGLPPRMVERQRKGLTAKAVLKASQSAAYSSLVNIVNSKLDECMNHMNNINWIAEDAPEHGNAYMNEIINYLETIFSSAQQILPIEVLDKVATSALFHISDSIVAAFLNDNLKRFTVNAVIGIEIDLKMIETFADEKFYSSGLSEYKPDSTLRDCLIEVRQLVNLLLSNQPENFMNPVIREKNYGALDYKKVANVCEKFKDSPDRLFGSLSNRNTQQNARKKSMDVLKRRLKDFG